MGICLCRHARWLLLLWAPWCDHPHWHPRGQAGDVEQVVARLSLQQANKLEVLRHVQGPAQAERACSLQPVEGNAARGSERARCTRPKPCLVEGGGSRGRPSYAALESEEMPSISLAPPVS